jgi:hypothetical protein
LVVSPEADAKWLASEPTSPVTAAGSHIGALEESPFQRFQRPCLSYPMVGQAKASPSCSCEKCGKSCCERLNSVVLMSRYFDPSHLHLVKGSSCEWAKSQIVLSGRCSDCLLGPDSVNVVTDDKLNQAIQPQTAAVVAPHVVFAVRNPQLKLRVVVVVVVVVMKFWQYRYDSFHCPDKEAGYSVSCVGSPHSADWRHPGKQDGWQAWGPRSRIDVEIASENALENASEEAALRRAFEERAFEAKGVLGTYRTYWTFVMVVAEVTEAYGMPLQTSCPLRDLSF